MRKPDLVIGPPSNPQTLRWHLIRWRGWQLCLHKWCRSDEDRALHDHTGDNVSILLTGRYRELVQHNFIGIYGPSYFTQWHTRLPFVPYFRCAETPHRIALPAGPVWSLWLRWPPRREWGFHCPKGWRHWRDFCAERDYNTTGTSTVGRGCD